MTALLLARIKSPVKMMIDREEKIGEVKVIIDGNKNIQCESILKLGIPDSHMMSYELQAGFLLNEKVEYVFGIAISDVVYELIHGEEEDIDQRPLSIPYISKEFKKLNQSYDLSSSDILGIVGALYIKPQGSKILYLNSECKHLINVYRHQSVEAVEDFEEAARGSEVKSLFNEIKFISFNLSSPPLSLFHKSLKSEQEKSQFTNVEFKFSV